MSLIVYCTAALTSLSDRVSYIIFLSSEWRKSMNVRFMQFNIFVLPLIENWKQLGWGGGGGAYEHACHDFFYFYF